MKLLALLPALFLVLDGQSNVWPGIERFLSKSFGLSRSELMAVRNGHSIVRALPSTDDREISSVGVVQVDVTPGDYIEQLRNITEFKRSEIVPQIGAFGVQPTFRDVERLTMPDDDRGDLATCRPGRCDVQLPADAMERISEAVKCAGSKVRSGHTLADVFGDHRRHRSWARTHGITEVVHECVD
jgi:hypothetical protein